MTTVKCGRDGGIRTHDPLTPSQVRYQAALHPDVSYVAGRTQERSERPERSNDPNAPNVPNDPNVDPSFYPLPRRAATGAGAAARVAATDRGLAPLRPGAGGSS
jgi:hypothetical protein